MSKTCYLGHSMVVVESRSGGEEWKHKGEEMNGKWGIDVMRGVECRKGNGDNNR